MERLGLILSPLRKLTPQFSFPGNIITPKNGSEAPTPIQTKARGQELSDVKILVLGDALSGKSTFIRHADMLWNSGNWTRPAYLSEYREVIFDNVAVLFKEIFRYLHSSSSVESDQSPLWASFHNFVRSGRDDHLDPEFLAVCLALWKNPDVQAAILKAKSAIESACTCGTQNLIHFLRNAERIAAPDFVPSTEDILRARIRSVGIHETAISQGGITITLTDAPGSRCQRKKWIKTAPGADVVLFMVSLDFYDNRPSLGYGTAYENTNQITEALQLFESLLESVAFGQMRWVLVLNKLHHFREKVVSGRVPIARYFPDYKADAMDIYAAQEYFADKFRHRYPLERGLLPVYFINAVDPDHVRSVIDGILLVAKHHGTAK